MSQNYNVLGIAKKISNLLFVAFIHSQKYFPTLHLIKKLKIEFFKVATVECTMVLNFLKVIVFTKLAHSNRSITFYTYAAYNMFTP